MTGTHRDDRVEAAIPATATIRASKAAPKAAPKRTSSRAEAPASSSPPVVIVYLPGLDEPVNGADSFAHRVATALDEESPVAEARYQVRPPESGRSVSAPDSVPRRIVEVLDGRTRAVADIYRFEYSAALRDGFDGASRAKQAAKLSGVVAYSGVSAVIPMLFARRRGKSGKAKAQWLFALAVFAALAVYAVVLLGAAAHATFQVARHDSQMGWIEYLGLLGGAAGTVLSTRVQAKLTAAAVNFYGATGYLALGRRRSNLSSRLTLLLEHVIEDAAEDARIYLVAYSFGSIVGIDSLFPPGTPRPAHMDRINGLVTIGCPFDIVRSVWPGYFRERDIAGAPPLWLNVFSPLDVLGSNFMDGDDEARVPEDARRRGRRSGTPGWHGVCQDRGEVDCLHPENVVWQSGPLGQRATAAQVLLLSGFKAHTMYWDIEDSTDVGCMRVVTSRLLADAPALRTVIRI